MADSQILMELKIVEKGGKISIVAQNMEKLAKETKKVDNAQKSGSKSGEKFHKAQKGVAQAGMNTTKSFSKMKETMGGSSGLVGAYATLAANVFAATAAFNALRGAAQVQTLAEGFGFLAGASGRTSEVIANNLQAITGNALSMEESLRTAAIGIQSGFSSTQLERLTEVAKNASIALGRNLGDSVDRLVRGVAKLEPEILDELGIIVRLESATNKYAATMNKSASELSEFERQQAFLNATIEQGELKYGALGDAVDVNPFDKLAGAFTNLTNKVMGFMSTALGPLVSLFSNSQLAMAGALTMFGSTIVTQMLPGLADLTTRQQENAKAARAQADAQTKAGDKIAKAQRKIVAAGSSDVASPAGFEKLQKQLKRGKASSANMKAGLDSLARSERARAAALDKYSGEELKDKQRELEAIRRLKKETEELIRVEANRGKSTLSGIAASGRADRADIVSDGVGDIQSGGALAGFKTAFTKNKELRKSLKATKVELKANGSFMQRFGKSAGASFRTAAGGAKLFGVALLNAIPFIGQLIFILGVAFTIMNKMFGASEKVSASFKQMSTFTKAQEENTKAFNLVQERLNEKLAETTDAYESAQLNAQKYANQVKFTAGAAGELADSTAKMQIALKEDGVTKFTVILEKAKESFSDFVTMLTSIPEKISGLIRRFVEFGATLPKVLGGNQFKDMLAEMDKTEAAASRGANEFQLYGMKTRKAFEAITDPVTKEKMEAAFSSSGGLDKMISDGAAAIADGTSTYELESLKIQKIINNVGSTARSQDSSIDNFAKGYDGLTQTLSKDLQAKKASDGFLKLGASIDGLIGNVADMNTSGISEENILGQVQKLANEGKLTTSLENLGFSLKDVVDAADGKGKLVEFSTFLQEASVRAREFKVLQATTKATLKGLEEQKNKMKEIFNIRQKQGVLEAKGTYELDGLAALKVAKSVFTLENTFRIAKVEKDKLLAQNASQVAIDQHKKNAALNETEREAMIQNEAVLLAAKEKAIDEEAAYTLLKLKDAREQAFAQAGKTGTTAERLSQIGEAGFYDTKKDDDGNVIDRTQERIGKVREAFSPMMDDLKQISPEGELYASIAEGALNIASSIHTIGDAGADTSDRLASLGSVFQSFGAIAAASSKARIAGVDSEINAEKRRDGKSKESLAKIKSLEAKKEAMKRKAFETDKKTKLATAVMNTASAMVAAASPPNPPLPASLPMVAMAGIMGAMQIAAISKTKYAGGGTSVTKPPSTISVGKRDNKVDVSKGATRGELSYLRGQTGRGNTANNFKPGAAAGRRGYAAGGEGIIVGERGPELIKPTMPIDVIPNDKLNGGTQNVNFTINAVDAEGVQDVLQRQRGNIIGMIREAANEHGENFMESVNVEAY